MPQAAISPILASTPVTAVAGANPQVSDRNNSLDTASAGAGGFADALKRQMGSIQEKDKTNPAADQSGATNSADIAPSPDGASVQAYAPTDLATLLAGLTGRAPFTPPRQAPLSSASQAPTTAASVGPLADWTTTSQADAVADTSGTAGPGDTAILPTAPADKYDVHGARNRRPTLESVANKRGESVPRLLVQTPGPGPVQTTAPSPADTTAPAAEALIATTTVTGETHTYKGNSDTLAMPPATTPATDAASAVAAQLLAAAAMPAATVAAATMPAAAMAVVPTVDSATPTSGKAMTPAVAVPKEVALPSWQNEFAATAGGNRTLAAADFAAVGKPVPGTLPATLPGTTESLTGSKNTAADAQVDNFQSALAASGAQQALEHARMADGVVRNQAQTVSATLATPFGTPGWSEDVGNKLVWMAGADHQQADLVLTPPNMGRIEVSITVKNEQATANFVAANSEVRDALEQSLPRLREMFANAGISLGQANVSGESSAGQQSGRENRGRRYSAVNDIAAASSMAPAPLIRGGNGMVDTFV